MADDDHAAPVVLADTGDQRAIFGESTIAVQLHEVLEQTLDVVVRVGAIRMARELHLLHRRKLGENLAREFRGFVLEPLELGSKTIIFVRKLAQLTDARDELHDGTLEGQDVRHSAGLSPEKVTLSRPSESLGSIRRSASWARAARPGVVYFQRK